MRDKNDKLEYNPAMSHNDVILCILLVLFLFTYIIGTLVAIIVRLL